MKRGQTMGTIPLPAYMKKEKSFALENLQKAENEVLESMQEFRTTLTNRNVSIEHFGDITVSYHKIMEEAEVAKVAKKLFEMKKVTAFLEILEQTISKTNNGFDRRFKDLIAEAAVEARRQQHAAAP